MKKKLFVLVVLVLLFILVLSFIAYVNDKKEIVYFIWIGILLVTIFIALTILLNKLVILTPTYNLLFANSLKFNSNPNNKMDVIRNYKVVSLGSNNALYAFHFRDIIGANWSTGLQTTTESFNILRKYHSYIIQGGYVILTLAPLGCLLKTDSFPSCHRAKYVPILPEVSARKDVLFVRFPIIINPFFSFRALLKAIISYPNKNSLAINAQKMDKRQLHIDAKYWVDGWKKQFEIANLDSPLSSTLLKRQKMLVEKYNELIIFAKDRGYKIAFVMPPVTLELSSYFSEAFFENYIYSFVNQFPDVPFLNYFKDSEFTDSELYFNSFFLNLEGRKKFTSKVLEDLGLQDSIK